MKHLEKFLYYGTLGLFVYMPFHIFLTQWLSTYTGGLNGWKLAKDIVTAALVALGMALVVYKRRYTKLYIGLLGFALAFFLLHLVLMFATDQPRDTGLLATLYNNRVIWYVLLGYQLALLVPKKNIAWTFAKALIAVSTVVCLIGFAQYILPKDVMTHFGYSIDRGAKPAFFIDDKPDLPRVFSTIRDPNSLGAFLILPIVILVDALIRRWKSQRRQFLGGLLMLHVLVLFLTFSRSAWIGAVLAVASLLALRYGSILKGYTQTYWLPVAVALLVLMGGLFMLRDQYVVQNVIFHADESTTMDSPNELRVELFEKSAEGIVDEPLGHGPGTAGLVSTKLQKPFLTENYYTQLGYEIGVLGLLMFLGFLSMILLKIWSLRQNILPQVLLASFVGVAFINLLLHGWANEAVAISWFGLAGLSLNSKNTN